MGTKGTLIEEQSYAEEVSPASGEVPRAAPVPNGWPAPSGRNGIEVAEVKCSLMTLVRSRNAAGVIDIADSEGGYVARALDLPLSFQTYRTLSSMAQRVGVTENFRRVIDYFKVPEGELPTGFRVELLLDADRTLRLDLVRDISYDKNGKKRPTKLLFSADTANPYEVEPIKHLIANLTCNPGIIYNLFINNPKANVGNRFKTRDEVMQELGRILGSGVDISVELNDPFGKSDQEILEEVCKFRELLSEYRVVIKVPHTGPVNAQNVNELLMDDKKFRRRYNQVATKDAFRGHNLALFLHEHGFRVNFTLMFEPYQSALALQARPYFINSFIRQRRLQSDLMKRALDVHRITGEVKVLEELRTMLVEEDYLSPDENTLDLVQVMRLAENILRYRKYESSEGCDGLDAVRHNLRLLRNVNMRDTRLIICSMEGEKNYPDIDNLLAEDEFADIMHRVVLTAEPNYLAQFTTCNQVISYQRRFLNAANGQK